MALGSVPTGASLVSNQHDEVLVVDNANIFDNLTISTPLPIRFDTAGVHVGGLAPSFVPNMTLTLEAGVTLKFSKWSTGPTMVIFGDGGQPTDKNAAFVVRGTAASPVTLTSDEAVPAAGDWAGIWLRTSNGSQIDHLRLEFAGGDARSGRRAAGRYRPPHRAAARRRRHRSAVRAPAVLITNSTFSNNAAISRSTRSGRVRVRADPDRDEHLHESRSGLHPEQELHRRRLRRGRSRPAGLPRALSETARRNG
jgi:hypothetical protein